MAEIEFYGETFTLAAPNEYALMRFARAGQHVEADSMTALATTLDLVEASIAANPAVEGSTAATEFDRFDRLAMTNSATTEALMPVVFAVFEQATERPTGQPADSSVGPVTTPSHSASPPVDQDMERFAGRPDMQLALVRTREAISA